MSRLHSYYIDMRIIVHTSKLPLITDVYTKTKCFGQEVANVKLIPDTFCLKSNYINPLNAKLNPICHLLALLGAHPILHVSRIWVKHDTLIYLIQNYYLIVI
jgi:hypothetical protein